MLGSCFSESIGKKLQELYIPIDNNPFGIVYNPISIARQLKRLLSGQKYSPDDLFFYNGLWASFDHHGKFSDVDASNCLEKINTRLENSVTNLRKSVVLFLTFGTSAVYYNNETSKPISNCHKLPTNKFTRRFLSVSEIVEIYTDILGKLCNINPALQVVFTVSPVRYLADGAHNNQLSKSVLLLAIDELCNKIENVSYFPSYEILLDELRDYRFFADDMAHPSELAINYIWSVFRQTFFNAETQNLAIEIEKIVQASMHRPFNQNSEPHQKFIAQYLSKIQSIKTTHQILMDDVEARFKAQCNLIE